MRQADNDKPFKLSTREPALNGSADDESYLADSRMRTYAYGTLLLGVPYRTFGTYRNGGLCEFAV